MANRKKRKYQPTRVEMKAALHHLHTTVKMALVVFLETGTKIDLMRLARLRAANKFIDIMNERMEFDAQGAEQ